MLVVHSTDDDDDDDDDDYRRRHRHCLEGPVGERFENFNGRRCKG